MAAHESQLGTDGRGVNHYIVLTSSAYDMFLMGDPIKIPHLWKDMVKFKGPEAFE